MALHTPHYTYLSIFCSNSSCCVILRQCLKYSQRATGKEKAAMPTLSPTTCVFVCVNEQLIMSVY